MKPEFDPVSGRSTTGHEWNGITELDTPVPKTVWFFLITTFLFSVGYWLFMPAWPLGATYTKGLLGDDERANLAVAVKAAADERGAWTRAVAEREPAAVMADRDLMAKVRESGKTLFGDNCAMCHGREATGGPGFPSLVRGTPLWGDTPEAFAETIRVGINSGHPDSRVSQMLAFGRDGILTLQQIDALVAYVRGLSHQGQTTGKPSDEGSQLFAANCVACHGDDGKGNRSLGAPDLTDATWIYGGDGASLRQSIWHGRQGQMPSWEGRLSAWERKLLAIYLVDLRGNAR